MPNALSKPQVEGVNISKAYGSHIVLNKVNVAVEKGQFLTILGPSGCGKTTLLRVISGLELADSGHVYIGGKDVSRLTPAKRGVGIVFQSYALFPNLTAWENVAYALKYALKRTRFVKSRVDELLNLVGLGPYSNHYPAQLSGGQQQRVALARALALSPELLLLDEPLSALDAKVRMHLRAEIKRLVKETGITTIMVTHDQEEALTMSDQVVVMNKGRIIQCATPAELYQQPADAFVASFIGSMNFIAAVNRKNKGCFKTELCAETTLTTLHDNLPEQSAPVLGIRPENVHLAENAQGNSNCFRASLKEMEYRGSYFRVALQLNDLNNPLTLSADWPSRFVLERGLVPNSPVNIYLPPEHLHAFAREEN